MPAVRLGMLTPSSNTVLEPISFAIAATLPDVSVHFSRLRVTEISLTEQALAQFDRDPFLDAADLLADLDPHAIAWNGTSAAWRGFDQDVELCDAIHSRFEVPATASMLALNHILERRGARRFALVTPYTTDVQERIIANYVAKGFDCVAEQHAGVRVNFEFAGIEADWICAQLRSVAAFEPSAIIIVCTNLRSAHLVERMEAELGIPIYDSTSATVWHSLRVAGVDTGSVQGWGSLFTDPMLND